MSRNSKNARLQKQEEALPKNRSAAAAKRRGEGKPHAQGRAAAPKHGKKNAWWQRHMTYSQFIKGGAKAAKSNKTNESDAEAGALA